MIIRFRSSVNLAGAWMTLMALAACGNNGAPPYPPEPQQATPTPAARAAGTTERPTTAPAAPDPHVVYDLREKCGEDARRWYQHFYEDGGVHPRQPAASHGFTSHYNSRTNDCFAVTRAITTIKEVRTLANVLENRDLGTFMQPADAATPAECHVAQQVCKSRGEWESLTAPYMSD